MLSLKVRQSALFSLWQTDASLAFGCTLQFNGGRAWRIGGRLVGLKPENHSEQTNRALAALVDQSAINTESIQKASNFLGQLETAGGLNHAALEARAVMLLAQGRLRKVRDLCKWAGRVSVAGTGAIAGIPPQHLWARVVWADLSEKLLQPQHSGVEEQIDRYLAVYASDDTSGPARAEALCALYAQLCLLYGPGVPAVLVRLMLGLMNALTCWPLLVCDVNQQGQEPISFSLPVFAQLEGINPSEKIGTGKVIAKCTDHAFQTPPYRNGRSYGFANSCLEWDSDFHRAMFKGLFVAKQLWLSQNRRIDDPQILSRYSNCDMEIDFTVACSIVQEWVHKPYCLMGRSAEGYWVQVALGLLLPGGRIPLGVCSATVEDPQHSHEYRLGTVLGVGAKLAFASRLGILQKLVLPRTKEVVEQIEKACRDGEIDIQSDVLEQCFCHTVRDAADVLQINGWRRARFVSTPRARGAYGRLSNALFELSEGNVPLGTRLPQGHQLGPTLKMAQDDLSRINGLSFSSQKSSVLFVPNSLINESKMGLWAAHQDHLLRTGQNATGTRAPGLGILVIKTKPGESDMRFWGHVFDELQANDAVWDAFQFGSRQQSAPALANLLNNFGAEPSISKQAAPDLLVIFDEAGQTQNWSSSQSRLHEERGNLRLLLNTQEILHAGQSHYLADALIHRDGVRNELFGRVRVLVIYPSQPIPRPVLPPMRTSPIWDIDILCVFRDGFSAHAAWAVLNAYRKFRQNDPIDWPGVLAVLDKLAAVGDLRQGRGEYYFLAPRRFDPRLPGAAEVHEAAGLAFMPLLASGKESRRNRRLEITATSMREAAWHFQQMYGLSDKQTLRNRARAHLATLGYLAEKEDWDTVKVMGYDKITFGPEARTMALVLLTRELDSDVDLINPQHCALALNAFTNSLPVRKKNGPSPNSHDLEQLVQVFDLTAHKICDKHRGYPTQFKVEVLVQSEMAFFLNRVIVVCKQFQILIAPEVWRQMCADLRELNKSLKLVVDELWNAAADDKYWQSVGLQHGWLQESWRGPRNAIRYAYAACATDSSPSPTSWAVLFAQLPGPKPGRIDGIQNDFYFVLLLWAQKITDPAYFAGRVQSESLLYQADQTKSSVLNLARKNLGAWLASGQVKRSYAALLQEVCQCFGVVV
jgi:hypothetical protein